MSSDGLISARAESQLPKGGKTRKAKKVDESDSKFLIMGSRANLGRKLILTHNPLEAIAENDRYRRSDVEDGPESGLYIANQLVENFPFQYKFTVPTFIPKKWANAEKVDQEEYILRFNRKFPEIFAILPIKNVVIAGGAASNPYNPTSDVNDIDIFIIGIDPSDHSALWNKVHEISTKIRNVLYNSEQPGEIITKVEEILTPGVVTFNLEMIYRDANKHKVRKFQIILRPFRSVSSLLHGFDISSCSVAFDGITTYMTYLAAWSLSFRTIIVNPSYRSPSYEWRLAKYFNRGFALAFTNLRRGILVANDKLKFPHITLLPIIVRSGSFAIGTITVEGEDIEKSDYEYYPNVNSHTVSFKNIKEIGQKNQFIIIKVSDIEELRRTNQSIIPGIHTIPFNEYALTEPVFSNVLSLDNFNNYLDIATKNICTDGYLNITNLIQIFKFNNEEVGQFASLIIPFIIKYPRHYYFNFSKAIAKHRKKITDIYNAVPSKIDWWIKTNPLIPFSVSLNPKAETLEKWYGDTYEKSSKNSSEPDFVEALRLVLEGRHLNINDKAVYDGICSLCLGNLTRGAINSIILQCGHIFHWSNSVEDSCAGLRNWDADHNACPTCRQSYVNIESTLVVNPELIIDINW